MGTRTQKWDKNGNKLETRTQTWDKNGNKAGTRTQKWDKHWNKVETRTQKWDKNGNKVGNKNPKVGQEWEQPRRTDRCLIKQHQKINISMMKIIIFYMTQNAMNSCFCSLNCTCLILKSSLSRQKAMTTTAFLSEKLVLAIVFGIPDVQSASCY